MSPQFSWRPRHTGLVVGLVCALVILGPALAPGFWLGYDMVFVPHLPLGERTLGIDGSVPRAVPHDAVVAVLSLVLPGWIVQQILLLGVFLLVGAGLGNLVRSHHGAVVATVVACWNPWVAQRLEVGHWGFLLGWALVPWLLGAAGAVRSRRPGAVARLLLLVVAAALTGSTGIIFGLLAVSAVLLPGRSGARRAWLWCLVVAAGVSATWWWPFLTSASRNVADPAGVDAFAARSDTPWGVLVSVLSGGGIWNEGVWYPERLSWLVSAAAASACVLCVLMLWRHRSRSAHHGAVVMGVAGVVLAVLGSLPLGREIVLGVVTHVPGGGLIRDSHKFAGVWMIAVGLGAGVLAELVWERAVRVSRPIAVLLVFTCAAWAPITLPSLAWGSQGSWQTSEYSDDMLALAEDLQEAESGAVAVFPWTQYRRFAWSHDRVMLDPWPRLVARDVRVNDALPLRDRIIDGEDPRVAEVSRAMVSGRDLSQALRIVGVRHVLLLTDQPNQDVQAHHLEPAVLRAEIDGVQWWDLGPVVASDSSAIDPSRLLGWGLAGLTVGGVVLFSVVSRLQQRRR